MAAYAALVSLLNNIHAITNHPTLSTSLQNKHIQSIKEKTRFLLAFIEGNNYGAGSKEAQDLERRIASAAHAAEDVIESHIVDRIRKPSLTLPYLLKSVVFPQKSLDLHQINDEMDAIVKEANGFKETHRSGEEQQSTHLSEPLMQSGESAMVGLDAELIQLLNELTSYQSSRRIISIVGMGGAGKTTLAKNVFENLLIKEKFQFRAWATMSQQNNAQEILSDLLSGVRGTIDELGLRLHKTLSGRRYLIVLDDIWSVTAWDEVKRFFPDNNNGSRILLTTRLSNVAKDCGPSLFMLNLLDKESSWKLFCKKAFENEDCPPELRAVGEEIVKLCKGLPLSIVVVGGLLLKAPRNIEYWKNVADGLKSISNLKEKQESLDVLSLSYNHLPPHLKPCFLYMGVFEEDSEIRVSNIIKLWVAEGFIKPTGSRVLEEIAEGYIKDLFDRNLIIVGKHRKYGKFGSCVIHDLLRDLCIKLAEEEEFFHVDVNKLRGIERRLVHNENLDPTKVGFHLTRSIVTGSRIMKPVKYKLLRVLNAVTVSCEAQADYFDNVNLRYLAFKNQHILSGEWKLPISVTLMWNLQTLDIVKSLGTLRIVAPIEFWKMRQIRHVLCCQIYLPCPPRSNSQDGLLIMANLQTLKKTINLRLSEEVCKIIPNVTKLHLDYVSHLWGYDGGDSLLESLGNFHRLSKLESLNMTTYICPDSELSKKIPTSFPISLKTLSLTGCELHWEHLTAIGSLPRLEVLKLRSDSVTRGDWSLVDGQFGRLKVLEINNCPLVRWDADESHFPVLEKLILINLNYLVEIPLSIGDIPTLELIHVDRCSNSAIISAVKIKEDQLDNDDLQVQVVVLSTSEKIIDKMLETEGLTLDNIQFEMEYSGWWN